MNKIVFTGGGTLGHVMPNIYLMNELSGFDMYYIGSNGIEKDKLKGKIQYFEIPSVKLDRSKFFSNFKIPFVLITAIKRARRILKEIKPDVVFSKGGYVSLPVCIASRQLKIPIITHESDYSFGLANRLILKFCSVMCVNFKNLEVKNSKCVYTGPIFGKQFERTDCKQNLNLNPNLKTILIIGGSLGSKIINENIYKILDTLLEKFNIIHITGKGNNQVKSHKNYISMEATDDVVSLYNVVDFVIGRSGAGVTAECYYKNLPMLLIPLENKSTRGDQFQNAKYYVDLGVAEIVRECDINEKLLYKKIIDLSTNLNTYKQKYKSQNKINGKQKIISLINEYANKNSPNN